MTPESRRWAELAALDDVALAVGLLRDTPTHENRTAEQLERWARTALDFGDELAADPGLDLDVRVEETARPAPPGEVLLAEYHHRRHTVTVHTDGLARLADVVTRAGWTEDAAPERLRAAAVAHEVVHHRLHGPAGRALRLRLDHTAARLGPLRLRGHVVGADEIVAHRFAHRRSGLRRSPLLLTAALAASLSRPSFPVVALGG
jgi:hypothetical protein